MGNYFNGGTVAAGVMAARNQPLGFDHPTVVPVNFEPDDQQSTDESESTERE